VQQVVRVDDLGFAAIDAGGAKADEGGAIALASPRARLGWAQAWREKQEQA